MELASPHRAESSSSTIPCQEDAIAVREIIRRATRHLASGRFEELPGDDARLIEDLAFDSIHLVELAMVIEDAFELEQIRKEDSVGIRTVGDIVSYVLARMADRGAVFPAGGAASSWSILEEVESVPRTKRADDPTDPSTDGEDT